MTVVVKVLKWATSRRGANEIATVLLTVGAVLTKLGVFN